jgi:PqqD family protein of HPr-rel-A system
VLFRAPPKGVLRHVRLDAMTAIYDRRSGETHLVAEVVPAILTALGNGDADVDDLARRLDTTELAALTERLDELAAAGLVERL